MSVYKIFAENLRRECLKFPSIAHVCREIGLNRQQFNKYLAGQIMPNQRTMAKIAEFFKIEEQRLFSVEQVNSNIKITNHSNPLFDKFEKSNYKAQQFLNGLFGQSINVANHRLPVGFYFCYTPLQAYAGFVVRSIIKISENAGQQLFSRRTSFRSNFDDCKKIIVGKHRGVVLSDSTSSLLIGRSMIFAGEITVLKIDSKIVEPNNINHGIALIHSGDEEISCELCLERLGTSLTIGKQASKLLGITAFDHPSVSVNARNHMVKHWLTQDKPQSLVLPDRTNFTEVLKAQIQN